MKLSNFAKFAAFFCGTIICLAVIASLSLPEFTIAPEYDPHPQNLVTPYPVSPSQNDQKEPSISGHHIVWSEKIGDYWQIVLFDLNEMSRYQITSDPYDHILPSVSGDLVIWWQGTMVSGVNHVSGQRLNLPSVQASSPRLGDLGIVWSGEIDSITQSAPIVYFDLQTQKESVIARGNGAGWPSINGHLVVWQERDAGGSNIRGYDLSANQGFDVVSEIGNQSYPDISSEAVVWEDNRNGKAYNENDIYGLDLHSRQEFIVSARSGNEIRPRISGNIVVWTDIGGDGSMDIYGYDLSQKRLFAIAVDEHANGQPDIDASTIVWTQWEKPNDRHAHSQIMYGRLTGNP